MLIAAVLLGLCLSIVYLVWFLIRVSRDLLAEYIRSGRI
jgi:hypothetical protein